MTVKKESDHVQCEDSMSPTGPKKAYLPPLLVIHGSVADLTREDGSTQSDGPEEGDATF
jgi:hypothetical protein